ncbi:unnamed protein product [Camellia sinensis]
MKKKQIWWEECFFGRPRWSCFRGRTCWSISCFLLAQFRIFYLAIDHQEEQKPKKQRFEHGPKFTVTSGEGTGLAYGEPPKPNLTPPSSFHGDNVASPNSIQISKNLATENEITSLLAESKDPGTRKHTVAITHHLNNKHGHAKNCTIWYQNQPRFSGVNCT